MKSRSSICVALLSLAAAGAAACSEETVSRGYDDQAPLYSNSEYTYSQDYTPAPAYSSAQSSYSNPGYTVPQPVYPSPQPSYSNPQPIYPQPSTSVVAVAPSMTVEGAVIGLRASVNNMWNVVQSFGPGNYPVIRGHLRNLDEQVFRLEDAVKDRDRPRRVREVFNDVQRTAENMDPHTYKADRRIRNAWDQVRVSLRETSDAINYRY